MERCCSLLEVLRRPRLSPRPRPERQHHACRLLGPGNGQGIRFEKAEDIVLCGTDADVVLRAKTPCQPASTKLPVVTYESLRLGGSRGRLAHTPSDSRKDVSSTSSLGKCDRRKGDIGSVAASWLALSTDVPISDRRCAPRNPSRKKAALLAWQRANLGADARGRHAHR